MEEKFISVSLDDDYIWTIEFNNELHNPALLNLNFIEELSKQIQSIASNKKSRGIIFKGKSNNFIEGTHLDEIAKIVSIEQAKYFSGKMNDLFSLISSLKINTVAAIEGKCFGSGLELALACRYRVATTSSKTQLSLPEVNLGLIPFGGGTQRLPRLVGLQVGLDMILTGRQVNARKALKTNLIDAAVPKQILIEQAKCYARRNTSQKLVVHGSSITLPKWAIEGNPLGRRVMHRKAKEMIDQKTQGFFPASYKALEAVFEGYDLSLENGLKLENILFSELVHTKQAQALIHLFNAKSICSIPPKEIKEAHPPKLSRSQDDEVISVLGGGLMGTGISAIAVDKGFRVLLSDPSVEAVGRALRNIRTFFSKKVDRRILKSRDLPNYMARISPQIDTIGFKNSFITIEAVYEDLDLKRKILKELEPDSSDRWIFATNTSAIPITQIASDAKRPENVVGMHFFSPVEKLPFLEIIRGDKTAPWVINQVFKLGRQLGKQVIIVRDSPGFYTTRSLAFFLAEATNILIEGTPIEEIDKALTDFGFPTGPICLIDEIGIDIGVHVLQTMKESFPDKLIFSTNLAKVFEDGRLGKKNQRGFYSYRDGKKCDPDEDIYKILGSGSTPSPADEIIDRCLLLFINETTRCLEEGILSSPYDGDIGAVYGLGFPAFWGGPFKYIDFIGAKNIVMMLENLTSKHGKRFEPTKILVDYAKKDLKFFPKEPWQTFRR